MIHPQISGTDAVVRVTCPTCSGDGGCYGEGGDRGEYVFFECPTCEGAKTVTEDDADDAPQDQREFIPRFRTTYRPTRR